MNANNRFDPPQPFAAQPGQSTPDQVQHLAGSAGLPPHGNVSPPSAPQPQKNWFARHKFLTAIGGVIALVIIVSALGGGDADGTEPTAGPSAEVTEPDAGNEAATDGAPDLAEGADTDQDTAGYRIGDTAIVGDMSYKVLSVETASEVGPSMFVTKAKGTFVVVNVEVTNNANESALVDSSFFVLAHGDKKYDADSSASLWANTDEDGDNNSFFLENLNPDLTMGGIVVFDVSETVASAADNVLVAQTGFWGTETVDILLAK